MGTDDGEWDVNQGVAGREGNFIADPSGCKIEHKESHGLE
jgi:hypothetical protein